MNINYTESEQCESLKMTIDNELSIDMRRNMVAHAMLVNNSLVGIAVLLLWCVHSQPRRVHYVRANASAHTCICDVHPLKMQPSGCGVSRSDMLDTGGG